MLHLKCMRWDVWRRSRRRLYKPGCALKPAKGVGAAAAAAATAFGPSLTLIC